MNLSKFSHEIQSYIAETEKRRDMQGLLDYEDCQRILEYAAETNSDALFGLGYYRFAEYYQNRQDEARALHCLEECIKYFLNANLYQELGKAYNMMGAASSGSVSRLVALGYFYIGLQYAEACGDLYTQALIHSNIGSVLLCRNRYTEAQEQCSSAIRLFEQTGDTLFGNLNIQWNRVRSGFCYLLLEENSEAGRILEQLQTARRESLYSGEAQDFCLALEVGYEAVCGSREGLEDCLERLETSLCKGKRELVPEDLIVPLATLLERGKHYRQLHTFIRMIDEKYAGDNATVYLDIYPFKSEYLLKCNQIDEYMEYTREYLKLYHRYIDGSRSVTVRILELQQKLSQAEAEQRDMRAHNQRLEKIALYDSMTNLPNRAYLNEYLSRKFEDAGREGRMFGVGLMDIDHFKEYNDTYGHLAGDICIEEVAGVLREEESDTVFCARYGGDEFMIVYSGMSVHEIRCVAEQIHRKIRELEIPTESGKQKNGITVSQGIFIRVPEEENREWDFNSMADTMLYQAKQEGRNCYRISTEFR